MSFVVELLNAATSAGPGPVTQFDEPHHIRLAQAFVTGSPSQAGASIEVSLDGINFVDVNGVNAVSPGFVTLDILALYVRANAFFTGGTSPALTVLIAVE